MSRRRVGLVLVAVAACLMAACSSSNGHHAGSQPSSELTNVSPSPTISVPPGTPSPTSTQSPSHPPAPPKPHSTAAPGNVSAAALGVAGAGTLKIPAWPHQPGMIWRGPDGSQGSTGTPSVALTFDDGPGPYTSQVLDVLDAYHVKATFCMIGQQIHNYRAVVQRMINDGMTLCDHTWNHNEKIGTHNVAYVTQDIQKMVNAVHAIDKSASVTYYRNPGGNFTPGTVRISELLGMRPLYWSVDTQDWTRPGTAAIEASLAKVHRDSIVLMHDAGGDRTETIAALKATLTSLKSRFNLIALPATRTVAINPGPPASPKPPASPSSPPSPADAPVTYPASSKL